MYIFILCESRYRCVSLRATDRRLLLYAHRDATADNIFKRTRYTENSRDGRGGERFIYKVDWSRTTAFAAAAIGRGID